MFNLDELQAKTQAFIQEGSEHQAKELLVLIPVLGQFIPTIPTNVTNPTMEIRWFESQGKLYPWGSFSWRKVNGIPTTSQDQQHGYIWATEITEVEISVERDGAVEARLSIGLAPTKHHYFDAGREWPAAVLEFLTTYFTLDTADKEDGV